MVERSSTDVVDSIVRSLRARLGERVAVDVIRAEVRMELAGYSTARVTQFVPILVESHVRTRLLGRSESGHTNSPKETNGRG